MNTYIYILTDSNRNCLHVGMTDDLQQAAKTYRTLNGLFFDAASRASRLVYHEAFSDEAEALRRFKELSRYTRMQKERLIRRRNPNWLTLEIGPARPPVFCHADAPNRRLLSTNRAQS